METEDTIVAIASPPTPGWRGIVRLSGRDTLQVLDRLGLDVRPSGPPHRIEQELKIGDPFGEVPASVLVWPGERSYTGQPSAEIHSFGSLPLLEAIVAWVGKGGARVARPGEFTLRAFLAGRLDLTQAEAVLGVIEAEGRGALEHALRQLAGNLSRPVEALRSRLLDLLADVEAGLDFVDEDIQFITDDDLAERLREIAAEVDSIRQSHQDRGESVGRPTFVLAGEPNAGKSRLLNRLVGSEAAIVANVAGTTRDAVSVETCWEGHPLRFLDTAGIEAPGHELGRLAQEQTRRGLLEADVRLWCVDSTRDDFEQAAARVRETSSAIGRRGQHDLWLATKSDASAITCPPPWIAVSAVTDQGISSIRAAVAAWLEDRERSETGSVLGTAIRSRESLARTAEAITAALEWAGRGEGHEWIATELRIAADALGEITGTVYTEEILDRVFSRFCIGK